MKHEVPENNWQPEGERDEVAYYPLKNWIKMQCPLPENALLLHEFLGRCSFKEYLKNARVLVQHKEELKALPVAEMVVPCKEYQSKMNNYGKRH